LVGYFFKKGVAYMSILSRKFIEVNKGKVREPFNAKIVRYKNNPTDTEVIIIKNKKEIFVNMESKTFGKRNSCKDSEIIKKLQVFACQRSKTKIRRLILCNNLWNHCGTTYSIAEDGLDREKVLYDNEKFFKRLSYQQNKKVLYVAVPEIQPERFIKYGVKVYHMHISLDFNITEREFFSAWNNKKCMECGKYSNKLENFQCKNCKYFIGVVWVKREKDINLLRNANYQAKYFSKGFEEEELNQRSFSQNRYLRSHDLKMPEMENMNLTEEEIIKINKNSHFVSYFNDGNTYNVINDSDLNDLIDSEKSENVS
jgi:hypothetical protein